MSVCLFFICESNNENCNDLDLFRCQEKIMPGCSSLGLCSFIEPKPVVNLFWHCACHWFLDTKYALWNCRRHGANLHNIHPVVSYSTKREYFYSGITSSSLPFFSSILIVRCLFLYGSFLFFPLFHFSNIFLKIILMSMLFESSSSFLQHICQPCVFNFLIAALAIVPHTHSSAFFSILYHFLPFTPHLMADE